jgi:hypothetical protein
VYKLRFFFSSVGHRVKTYKVTPATDNEHGDIEIKSFVILPPEVSWRSSTVAPHPDGTLKNTVRIKIRHYRHLYGDRPDPIVFLPVAVRTSGLVYDDFARVRLLFLHVHREHSSVTLHQPHTVSNYATTNLTCTLLLFNQPQHPDAGSNSSSHRSNSGSDNDRH